jgi:chromate transporter
VNALQIALTIMVLNVLTFGNGPALIPLLEERFVEEAGILSLDQLLYAFAVARVMPGPANAYVAAVGFFLNGLLGAALAMVAIQLPAYLILPLLRLHERFRGVAGVRRFTRGLTATSVGLIFAATVSIGRNTLTSAAAVIVFTLALVMAYVLKWNPIVSLVVAVLAGLVLYFAQITL